MSVKKYFSYIRVSTQRQGQHGTSLAEQQAAIESFATSWSLQITKRFEERETAAKQGRPVFLEMLKQLRKGSANGVIIHKIDRSARNLKDWADLGSLIDSGVEVHFASESLDLNSRGGRLSADIQAVVASDYIRNLREETKKGLYGRLKQGLYPFPAMVGYLNRGKGQPKEIELVVGPLIRKAFELYSTGDWGLIALSNKMYSMGLRNKSGKQITINGLSTILHNPFYMGVIKIEKTGEVFAGVHKPIITRILFEEVQKVLAGKNVRKQNRHFFVYRRLIRCYKCSHLLIAERQKGWVYYRCHTKKCLSSCLKEEVINETILKKLEEIKPSPADYALLRQMARTQSANFADLIEKARQDLVLQQQRIKDRLSRLVDSYMDGVFDKETYLEKKNSLVFEEQALKVRAQNIESEMAQLPLKLEEFLELANSAYLSFKSAKPVDRRELVKTVISNFTTDGKSLTITLQKPLQRLTARVPFHLW